MIETLISTFSLHFNIIIHKRIIKDFLQNVKFFQNILTKMNFELDIDS